MRKIISVLVLMSFAFTCLSAATVKRLKSGDNTDLDGYWNATDVKLVCTDIVKQVIASPRIEKFTKKYNREPIVSIGKIRNISSEVIDMRVFTDRLRTAILKSGVLEFMANDDAQELMRQEISEQQDWANEDKVKSLANEDGADFYLSGSINTDVHRDGNTEIRQYLVTIDLNDLESGRVVDSFEPSDEVLDHLKKKITGKVRN